LDEFFPGSNQEIQVHFPDQNKPVEFKKTVSLLKKRISKQNSNLRNRVKLELILENY
jgi:hypothetical protein